MIYKLFECFVQHLKCSDFADKLKENERYKNSFCDLSRYMKSRSFSLTRVGEVKISFFFLANELAAGCTHRD